MCDKEKGISLSCGSVVVMMLKRLSLVALIPLALGTSAAQAGTFQLLATRLGPTAYFTGDIEEGDGEKLNHLLEQNAIAAIAFKSDGGDLEAGLMMGRTIHAKGLTTIVTGKDGCYSACALAWVGGTHRLLGKKAEVGFHAAYYENGSETQVSSSGNALVGAYLNQLGLGNEAVEFLTDTNPDDMALLSPEKAASLGIALESAEGIVLGENSQTPPRETADATPAPKYQRSSEPQQKTTGQPETTGTPQSPETPKTPETSKTPEISGKPRQKTGEPTEAQQQDYCFGLVGAYLKLWNSKEPVRSNDILEFYAEKVDYYGKSSSGNKVAADKAKFSERWPVRSYSLSQKSAEITRDDQGPICKFTGDLHYRVDSPERDASAQGESSWQLDIALDGENSFIFAETSKEIKPDQPEEQANAPSDSQPLKGAASLQPAPGYVYIVSASEPSEESARKSVKKLHKFFPDARIFASGNGYFAIVVEEVKKESAKTRLAALIDQNLVTTTSYLSNGDRFTSELKR